MSEETVLEQVLRESAEPLPIRHNGGVVVWQGESVVATGGGPGALGGTCDFSAAGSWRTAVDPRSRRIYYYNRATKMTRWDKPDELRDPAERQESLDFFQAMEKAILDKIEDGRKQDTPCEIFQHLNA